MSLVDTSSPNVISPLALGEEFSTHAQLDSIAFLSAQFSVWSSKNRKPHNPCDIFVIFLATWTFSSWVIHKSVQRSIAGFKILSTDRTLKVYLHSIHFQVCNIFSHRRLSFRYINSDQLFGDYLPKRWHSFTDTLKFRETRSNTETLTGNFHIQHGIQYLIIVHQISFSFLSVSFFTILSRNEPLIAIIEVYWILHIVHINKTGKLCATHFSANKNKITKTLRGISADDFTKSQHEGFVFVPRLCTQEKLCLLFGERSAKPAKQ